MFALPTCGRNNFSLLELFAICIQVTNEWMRRNKKWMLIFPQIANKVLKSVSNLWGCIIHSAYAGKFKPLLARKIPGLTLTFFILVQIFIVAALSLPMVSFKGEICQTCWLRRGRPTNYRNFTPKIVLLCFNFRKSSNQSHPIVRCRKSGQQTTQHKSQYGFCCCACTERAFCGLGITITQQHVRKSVYRLYSDEHNPEWSGRSGKSDDGLINQ